MTLTAAYGVPASAVDEDAVAYSASVRGLGASVGTLTKRLGTLEGHVGDTGRRLQTQGASIEALARSVTALRSTVQQGFAEMKALTKQQHVNANQQVSHPGGGPPSGGSSGASASAGPADLGFRTGRTIRGANPAVPIDTPAFILRDIGAIRRLMNDDLTQRTAWAVINRDVYLDGDEVFNLMIDKTMEHRKDEADEAEEWLLKAFDKPNVGSFRSKKGKDRVERVKPFPNGDNDDSYEKLYSDQVTMAAEEAAMGALAEADAGAAAGGAAVGAADAEADAAARAAEALARP
ncbi:hypothetical protein I4F81_008121 [Pyropia yezoensis]|uniref:Uncharacterized protein n=2 Tax=Pyropia yezoensis TaxID=2788 RepID=A0ACC3C612_PYRYE|nr:hypothetical protein I4F81_002251 [Neopyropia yezoensis]KAK1865592.1 hypothetical protein I4F81_008121 [Neopyropia yezoensis]